MIKKCLLCNSDFIKGLGEFCSKECWAKDYHKTHYIKKISKCVCLNCKKEFEGDAKRKYCSIGCRSSYVKIHKSILEPIGAYCERCGKLFVRGKKGTKYCSDVCRWKKPKIQKNRSCRVCGTIFPMIRGKIYCSDNCKPKRIRNDQISHKCLRCGTNFIGQQKQIYCCRECRNAKKRREKIDKTGKSCEYCRFGDKRAIHAHHINKTEHNDIMFLCANHHYIFHAIVGHGKKAENKSREEVLNILSIPVISHPLPTKD